MCYKLTPPFSEFLSGVVKELDPAGEDGDEHGAGDEVSLDDCSPFSSDEEP